MISKFFQCLIYMDSHHPMTPELWNNSFVQDCGYFRKKYFLFQSLKNTQVGWYNKQDCGPALLYISMQDCLQSVHIFPWPLSSADNTSKWIHTEGIKYMMYCFVPSNVCPVGSVYSSLSHFPYNVPGPSKTAGIKAWIRSPISDRIQAFIPAVVDEPDTLYGIFTY